MVVRSREGISRTSTASRPVSGIRLGTPSSASTESTSITNSIPLLIHFAAISAFTDLSRSPSSTSVGIGPDLPATYCEWISSPSS